MNGFECHKAVGDVLVSCRIDDNLKPDDIAVIERFECEIFGVKVRIKDRLGNHFIRELETIKHSRFLCGDFASPDKKGAFWRECDA